MEPRRPGSLQDLFVELTRPQLEADGLSGKALDDALELAWKLVPQSTIDDLRHGYRDAMIRYKADVARYKTATKQRN
jgi:hypothetical protein